MLIINTYSIFKVNSRLTQIKALIYLCLIFVHEVAEYIVQILSLTTVRYYRKDAIE